MSTTPAPNPQTPAGLPQGTPNKGVSIIVWILGGIAVFVFLCVLAVAGLIFFVAHKAKQAGFDPELMKKNPVYAAFKIGATASPDAEIISSDDDSGTLTIRDKKSGKVAIVKFDPESKSMVVTDENGKTASMKIDPVTHSLVMTDVNGKTAKITTNDKAGNIEIQGPDGTMKMGDNADKQPSWVPVYPGSSPKNTFSATSAGEQTGSYQFTTTDSSDKILSYFGDTLKSGGFKVSTTSTNQDGKTGGMVIASMENEKKTVTVTVGSDEKGTEVNVMFNSKN